MEEKKVKRLNPNKLFIPQSPRETEQAPNLLQTVFKQQDKFVQMFNTFALACEAQTMELDALQDMLTQCLKGKQSYFVKDFEIFLPLAKNFLGIMSRDYPRKNNLVKLLGHFQLKSLKKEEEKRMIELLREFIGCFEDENPYLNRYLIISIMKVLDPILKENSTLCQLILEVINGFLKNNVYMQTVEGLLLILSIHRDLDFLFKSHKNIRLSEVEKSFIQLNKYLFIGTEKFILKQYLIHRNDQLREIFTGISDCSESENRETLNKLEVIFQKIRNYSCLCLATIIRQYPKLIINTKNFFTLIKPIIITKKSLQSIFTPSDKPVPISQNCLNQEACLVQLLINESFQKNKINIINVMTNLIEQLNQKYTFQSAKYEKDFKITNPNFLPIAHQVYNAIKHLFCGLFLIFQKETDSSVMNHALRFLTLFISKQFLEILPNDMIKSLYTTLINFLKTSEEISVKSNALNCLSQLVYLEKKYDFIEQDLLSGFNLISYALNNVQKQLNIESLQTELTIVKSGSVTWLFENLLFVQKIQKSYGEYFFPYYEDLQRIFTAIQLKQYDLNNPQIVEYQCLRLKFCYKIIEEITKNLQPHLYEHQSSILEFTQTLFPHSLEHPHHEIVNTSISIARNILSHIPSEKLKQIVDFLLNSCKLQTISTQQNYFKLLNCLVKLSPVKEDLVLRKEILRQMLEKQKSVGVETLQATALNSWVQEVIFPHSEPILEKIIYFCKHLHSDQAWLALRNLLLHCEPSFIDNLITNQLMCSELKELIRYPNYLTLKHFNPVLKAYPKVQEQLLDISFFTMIQKRLQEEIQIQYQIQIFKFLLDNYGHPKFKCKQQIADLCFSFINQEANSLKYEDFKSFQKFKKHLTHLSLLFMANNLNFHLVYPFYQFFWQYLENLLAPAQVQKDFDDMEKFVENQMGPKQSIDLDVLQNKDNQVIIFDLNLIQDQSEKQRVQEQMNMVKKACVVLLEDRTLPQFNYTAFEQFSKLNMEETCQLFY